MKQADLQMKMLGGLWGAVVGDALGVPVEFMTREDVRNDPVTDMRGFGTFKLPAGSWSDDSSLLLCTADSLVHGFDLDDMAKRFKRWLSEGLWTPYGKAFDVGNATRAAIRRLNSGISPDLSGGDSEKDNGNGSLMRILPVALYFHQSSPEEMLRHVHMISSITHRHPRSQMACGIYCIMARFLLEGLNPVDAYMDTVRIIPALYGKAPYISELEHFSRIVKGSIQTLHDNEINSSGYVIDTLEASIWCLLTSRSYSEAVLTVVNLGHDTDTTGCVTGGLAGILYGYSGIPGQWIDSIARRDDIAKLFEGLVRVI